jgi:uncharacterized membrane protein YccC
MAPLSMNSLRGKQSVRVTFKLTPETIDLLSVMASQLGIKQKTLFDQLIDQHNISQLSRTQEQEDQRVQPRRQKTFVLSQETVETLNLLAERYQAPRNLLVERSIRRLLPILAAEQEKHEKRKMLLGRITQEVARTRHLLKQAIQLLGADDPICREISEASQCWHKAYANTLAIIERGKGMENF